MKLKWQTTLLAITLFFSLGFSVEVTAQTAEPTMEETINFLIEKAELIRDIGEGQKYESRRAWKLENPERCELIWTTEETNAKYSRNSIIKGKPKVTSTSPTSVTIFLSNFDPTKVSSSDSSHISTTDGSRRSEQTYYGVYLVTTDKKKSVEITGGQKDFTTDSLMIGFENAGIAKRYGSALRHAITLCGGTATTEKKEPF
jgi:hypothetical protein